MPPARRPAAAAHSRPLPTLATAVGLGVLALGTTGCRPPLCLERNPESEGQRTIRQAIAAPFRCPEPPPPVAPATVTPLVEGGPRAVTPTPPDPSRADGEMMRVGPEPPEPATPPTPPAPPPPTTPEPSRPTARATHPAPRPSDERPHLLGHVSRVTTRLPGG